MEPSCSVRVTRRVGQFVEQVGVSKIGVMAMPKWGNGPYAGRLGSTSQTLGITAWTKYPEVVADFIMFVHTPDRMTSFFKTTGAFGPATAGVEPLRPAVAAAAPEPLVEYLKGGLDDLSHGPHHTNRLGICRSGGRPPLRRPPVAEIGRPG